MEHRNNLETQKKKPRGRPFSKGNKRGKLTESVLAASRSEISDGRRNIALSPQSSVVEQNKQENEVFLQSPPILENLINAPLNEKEDSQEKARDLELIESLQFKNGEHTLSIRFSRKNNRMYRIQVFLDEINEIRPATYNGSVTAYAFWNLLKGALGR